MASVPAPGPNPIRLSLVMMAKDEEARLGRALASVRDWVDEIVLVDTGSRDRTVEIAQEFGARVFHHRWENDFAKHRNQALAQARGEWCFTLDADEALDSENAPALPGLLDRGDVAGYMVEVVNVFANGERSSLYSPRLFRRLPGVKYVRPVHNTLRLAGPKASCSLRVLHYGFDGNRDFLAAKRKRRLDMTGEWVRREPDNWEAHCYLAQALHSEPRFQAQAQAAAMRSLDLLQKDGGPPAGYSRAYYPLLNMLAHQNRAAEVISHGLDCVRAAPDHPDAYLFLTWAYHRAGDWQRTLWAGRRFLSQQRLWSQTAGERPSEESHTQGHFCFVLYRMAEAAANLAREGEFRQAVDEMLRQWDGQGATRQLAQTLAKGGLGHLARLTAGLAARAHPEWAWPREIMAAPPAKTGPGRSGTRLAPKSDFPGTEQVDAVAFGGL